MNIKILVAFLVISFLAACKKDKYNTKPTLVFKSVSADVVPVRGSLRFEFEVFDKEGDISDTFYFRKVRINKRFRPTVSRDTLKIKFPNVPDTRSGIIELNLTYDNYLTSALNPGNPPEPDTLLFKFAIRDKAKNVSDTFTSNPIVIIR